MDPEARCLKAVCYNVKQRAAGQQQDRLVALVVRKTKKGETSPDMTPAREGPTKAPRWLKLPAVQRRAKAEVVAKAGGNGKGKTKPKAKASSGSVYVEGPEQKHRNALHRWRDKAAEQLGAKLIAEPLRLMMTITLLEAHPQFDHWTDDKQARKLIAGELFEQELIVRFVVIERFDDIVAIPPDVRLVAIAFVTVGLGKADQVEPVHGQTLAEVRRGEEAFHQSLVRAGGGIREKLLELVGGRRKPREVEVQSSNEGVSVGRGRWLQSLPLEACEDPLVDGVPCPAHFLNRRQIGATGRNVGPVPRSGSLPGLQACRTGRTGRTGKTCRNCHEKEQHRPDRGQF